MECNVTGFAGLYAPPGSPQIIISVEPKDYESFAKYLGKPAREFRLKFWRPRAKSVDANAYLWVLCEKIAKVIRGTKEDVYRQAIRHVGVWQDMYMQPDAVVRFAKSFTAGHVGRFVEVMHDYRGSKLVRVYYGSADYDQKELSRVIDYVVDEAKNLGIETETPAEIARIKSLWGE